MGQTLAFESALEGSMFSATTEKTFVDKVLAREDVNAIRELVKKPRLTRSDLLEILYLISSTESKLLNYSDWERYVILKYFVWVREFIKVAELLYDYEDSLHKKENICSVCKLTIKDDTKRDNCKCSPPSPIFMLTPRTQKLLDNNARLIEHNAKFLVDLYLNISRTSLSVGATGLMELLRNKYEIQYNQQLPAELAQQQNKGWGLFKR